MLPESSMGEDRTFAVEMDRMAALVGLVVVVAVVVAVGETNVTAGLVAVVVAVVAVGGGIPWRVDPDSSILQGAVAVVGLGQMTSLIDLDFLPRLHQIRITQEDLNTRFFALSINHQCSASNYQCSYVLPVQLFVQQKRRLEITW